ncbi:MAG: hypothetical protein ABSE90_11580 [Verrucomicrobiota bacterium]
MTLIALAAMLSLCTAHAQNETNVQTKAEASFREYFKAIDPGLHYAEVKGGLFQKHLPGLRLFVRTDSHIMGQSRIFVVNPAGMVTDLGEDVWVGDNDAQCFRVRRITEFVKSRKIKLQNADGAIETAKLVEEIQGAPGYIEFLRTNTKNYTSFDRGFMEEFYGASTNWNYTATPNGPGWIVKVKYVGPPASVQAPPIYEIDVDDQNHFSDLRRHTEFTWYFVNDDRVFDVSYDTMVAKLKRLQPNPAAGTNQISACEVEPAQIYYLKIPETPPGDPSETYTSISVRKVSDQRTQVNIETVKHGVYFNTRDVKIEQQRLKELTGLLENHE